DAAGRLRARPGRALRIASAPRRRPPLHCGRGPPIGLGLSGARPERKPAVSAASGRPGPAPAPLAVARGRTPGGIRIPMSLYVVAYDVHHDGQRERVARVLLEFGRRVERSVFEVWLEPQTIPILRRRV